MTRKRERASVARVGFVGCCALVAACTSSDAGSASDPPCVTGLTADCAASYAPPTFDADLHEHLPDELRRGDGHVPHVRLRRGGIVFAEPNTSYATLLGSDGGTAYVLPGDPGCSTLMKRLESTDPNYHMPKGPTSLSAGDLCTIVQWIANGAAR